MPVFGQDIPFDRSAWRNYTYVNDVMGLAVVEDTLWVATTGGLVRLTANALDAQTKLTNADGLGDIDLRFVSIDSTRRIWTGGVQGRLSCRLRDDSWDIGNFEINGARIPLNAAAPGPDEFLWIASNVGVHKFDMRRNGGEIKETYTRLGSWPASNPARDVLVAGGSLWVVGPAGVARADIHDQFLLDPTHWRTWVDISGLNTLASFEGLIFAGGTGGLYVYADTMTSPPDTAWTRVGLNGIPVNDLFATDDTLWIATSRGLAFFAGGRSENPPALGSPSVSLTSVARTSDGSLWMGMLQDGIWRLRQNQWTALRFDGPMDKDFGDIEIGHDQTIWCVHPIKGADYLDPDSNRWVGLPFYNVGPSAPGTSVAVAPNGDVWFGAWGGGAYRVNSADPLHDWVRYDTVNSSLMWVKDQVGVNNYIVVRDVAIDSQGRVWFANAAADSGRVLAYYDPTGDGACWGSFGSADGLSSSDPAVLLALERELLIGFGNIGLIDVTFSSALCNGPNPVKPPIHLANKTTDDGLPSNDVRAILLDRADSLWVGTTVGLVRWAADIRRFLNVPLPADAGLSINALAADALNTVWVGTDRGMVMIPSGGKPVYFSPENSGLVGSSVHKIAVDERTGDVWIATGSGLSRLAAGVPIAESLEDILAYPNPLELETGVENRVRFNAPFGSRIYIFTVAGEPVADFDATAGWNGSNSGGNFVASGVYLFVVRGPDGDIGRGKIAVIRRR